MYTKYDKICVFEKNPHENYHCQNKSRVEWSRISRLFSKSMPLFVRVYIGSFSIFIFIFMFTNKFPGFFVTLWHPIFKRDKRNEVTEHMKHAAISVTCTLHWESQCSYKKIVIIKMNKMLYFSVIVFWMFATLGFTNDFSIFEGFLMPSIGSYT